MRHPGVLGWIGLILSTLSRAVLVTLASLLVWAAIPAVWGWVPTTVASDSMAPRIRTGDVVVAVPGAELRPGRVLLVDDPDHLGRLRLHRLIEIDPRGLLVLRGDANAEVDSSPVELDAVHGVGMIRVPLVGLPRLWMSRGDVLPLALLGVVLVGLTAVAGVRIPAHRRRRGPPAGGSEGGGDPAVRSGIFLAARTGLALGIALVIASTCAIVAPPARAGFTARTSADGAGFSASSTFPCFDVAPLDSPIFAYRFNEPGGVAVLDSTPNARLGTLQDGVTRVAGACPPGRPSPYIALDGSAGSVSTITATTAPSAFSTEIWFRTTTTRGGRLIGFGSSATGSSTTTDRHVYLTNSGRLTAGMGGLLSGVVVTSPTAYNDGQWHQVVVTGQVENLLIVGLTTTVTMFVDGVQVGSGSKLLGPLSYTGYWRIGTDSLTGWASAPTSFSLAGDLDDAAVYPIPLTAARVAAHYAAGR